MGKTSRFIAISRNVARALMLVLVFQAMCYAQELKAVGVRESFVEYGKQYIGRPYVRGAIGPKSFDCSGLVYSVASGALGLQLPRTSRAIYKYAVPIEDSEREAGDLVFFKTTSSGNISHCGIYIGEGKFLHVASDGPKTGVIISSLEDRYWKHHYAGSGRIIRD